MVPRIGLGALEKTKFLVPDGNRRHSLSAVQPVATSLYRIRSPRSCTPHTALLHTTNLQVSVHVGTQHLPHGEESALHPHPTPYRLLTLLEPEGARLIPSLLQGISKDRTILTGCAGRWLYGSPYSGEPPESRVRILAESQAGESLKAGRSKS